MADDKDGGSAEAGDSTYTKEQLDAAVATAAKEAETRTFRAAQSAADTRVATAEKASADVIVEARKALAVAEKSQLEGMTEEQRQAHMLKSVYERGQGGSDRPSAGGAPASPASPESSPTQAEQAQAAVEKALRDKGLDPSKLDLTDVGKFVDGILEQARPTDDAAAAAKKEADEKAAEEADKANNKVGSGIGSGGEAKDFVKLDPHALLVESRNGVSPWAASKPT